MRPRSPAPWLTIALCASAPTLALAADDGAALRAELQQMAAELAMLKTQIAELKAAANPAPPHAAASRWDVASAPAAPAPAELAPPASSPATVLTSYGEINYNRPTRRGQDTQVDVRRVVLGAQHRLDERTKVMAELEVEHAVSSAGDPGEVAIEQAYVERQLTPTWAGRAGLFLLPVGLLNENHEPTAYYGVERNFVETTIIPTTWREAGVQAIAALNHGWTLQGGIATSFNLNQWDASDPAAARAPLAAIHQEGALAKARNLGVFGAVHWRGVPGLTLGASLFSGGAAQGQTGRPPARVTLWDLHARYTPGRWDLAALYAQGRISRTAAWNAPLVGSAALVPARFDGAYLQAAYHLWQSGDWRLTPFVRLERFNPAARYASLGAGLTPPDAPYERVLTLGANLALAPGVVLKADWQRFSVDRQANRVNLGLGWSF